MLTTGMVKYHFFILTMTGIQYSRRELFKYQLTFVYSMGEEAEGYVGKLERQRK